MIHQYKNIVLDVNSGSVHVVDDVVYDLIPLVEEALDREQTEEEMAGRLKEALGNQYSGEDIQDALAEILEPCVFTLPMTVTWPVSTALQRKGSTTADAL